MCFDSAANLLFSTSTGIAKSCLYMAFLYILPSSDLAEIYASCHESLINKGIGSDRFTNIIYIVNGF